jgi:hypothetical protein
LSEEPLLWEALIKDAYAMVANGKRNYGSIAGFYTGLASRHPAAVEAFKREAVHSSVYTPILPFLCLRLGIKAADVLMVCAALQEGTLPPTAMSYWGMGGVFSKLGTASAAPLFNYLLAQEGVGYSVALDIMGMFVHGQPDRLEELRPQLLLAVDNVRNRTKRHGSQMDAHHFRRWWAGCLRKVGMTQMLVQPLES